MAEELFVNASSEANASNKFELLKWLTAINAKPMTKTRGR